VGVRDGELRARETAGGKAIEGQGHGDSARARARASGPASSGAERTDASAAVGSVAQGAQRREKAHLLVVVHLGGEEHVVHGLVAVGVVPPVQQLELGAAHGDPERAQPLRKLRPRHVVDDELRCA
jgi:hypothetical protein